MSNSSSSAAYDQWQNQVAVVTGAGSGIGAALATHCAQQGMQVIAADIDAPGLAELEANIQAINGKVQTRNVDVRSEQAVAQLADDCFSQYQQVNLLFNNAGVLVDGKSWERSVRDWRWNFDVNVMGVIHGIHSFVPKMLAQNSPGKIINTASIGGLLAGGSFLAPYQATKHAVVAITESLYAELAMEAAPVSAACLCPGDTATGIWESDRLRPEEEHNHLASQAEQLMHNFVADMCANGFTPQQIAEKTFEAIEQDRFWIFPQPEFKALFQPRVDAIINETAPPLPQELMDSFAQKQ